MHLGRAFALHWIQALSFPVFTVHTQNLFGLCIHIAFKFLELENSYPKLLTLDASFGAHTDGPLLSQGVAVCIVCRTH